MAEPAPRHVRLREVACRTAKARLSPPDPASTAAFYFGSKKVEIKSSRLLYSTFSRPTGRRSNVMNSIRKTENKKVSNRQCGHLNHSCSYILFANQT